MKKSTSQKIAIGMLIVDAVSTFLIIGCCYLAIMMRFDGALPYLTTLIGSLQACTAIVLHKYYGKSQIENTKGGIIYDSAIQGRDSV